MINFFVKNSKGTLKIKEEKAKMGKKKWFLLVIAVLTIGVMISVCGPVLADPISDSSVGQNNSVEDSEAYRYFLEHKRLFISEEFVERYKDELIAIARAAGEEMKNIRNAYKYHSYRDDYWYYSPSRLVEEAYVFLPEDLMENYAPELVEIAKAARGLTGRAYKFLPKHLMKDYAQELVEIAKAAGRGTDRAYEYLPEDLMKDYAQELIEIAKAAGEGSGVIYKHLPKSLIRNYPFELVEIARAAKQNTNLAYEYLPRYLMQTHASQLVEIARAAEEGTPLAYRYIQWNNNNLISLELAEKFKEIIKTTGGYCGWVVWGYFPYELVADYIDELVEIAKAGGGDGYYSHYENLPKDLMKTNAQELVKIARAAKKNTNLAYRYLPKDLMKDYATELVEIARATGEDVYYAYKYLPKDLMKTNATKLVEIARAAGPGILLAYRYIQWNNNRLISLELAGKFKEISSATGKYDLWESFPKELVADCIDELVEIAKAAGRKGTLAYKYLPKDLRSTQATELVEIAKIAGEATSFVYRYIQWNNNELVSLEMAGKLKEIFLVLDSCGFYFYSMWESFPKELVVDCIDELAEIAKIAGKKSIRVYKYLPRDLMKTNAQELVEIAKAAGSGLFLAYRYIQWNDNKLISLELAEKFKEIGLVVSHKDSYYGSYYGSHLWDYFPKELVDSRMDELVEITKAVGKNVDYVYKNLPKDLMETHPQELVKIAKAVGKGTDWVYSFIKASEALLTVEQAQEFIQIRNSNLKEIDYNKRIAERGKRYKDFIKKLANPQIEKLAKYLYYDLWSIKKDFGRAKILLLIEKIAPEKVDFISSFLRGRGEWGYGDYYYDYRRHLDCEEVEKVVETAEILTKLLPSKELNNYQQEYLRSNVSRALYSLARTVDYLHDQVTLREKVASSLSPQICYFIIGGREEIYTSSFNLLFDNLAFRLAGGEGLLAQERERRSQAQNQRIDIGERKILDYLEKIDPDRTHFFHFITKTSYYGRLYRIIPQGRQNQKEFLRQILRLMEAKGRLTRNVFYLSPTFEDIFTLQENLDLKGSLEEVLLEMFAGSKDKTRKIYGLLILRYLQYFSKDSRTQAEHVAKKVQEECGIDEDYLSQVPTEWLEPQADEERPTIKVKLYFENEGLARKGQKPVHYGIAKALFTNRKLNTKKPGKAKIIGGYEAKELNDNEELLFKRIGNIEVKIILSIAKKANITQDWQDPTIDIIAHRGHSYQIDFFRSLKRGEIGWSKGVFLGSCGGFNDIPSLDRILSNQTQFIASKSEGRGIINNVIIYFLVEALAEGLRDWNRIKAYIFEKIEGNLVQIKKEISQNVAPCQAEKLTIRRLRTYSFPADLPMLILRYVD